jgi:uncharacterized radical SAM superfamily Fe-S cluster-containing enzyme
MFERKVKSICPVCGKGLDGRYYEDGGRILLEKVCGEHGKVTDLVSSDAELFKDKLSLFDHLKDHGCDIPKCREGIFKCAAHRSRKSPLSFIEITTRCNMKCPVCYADADAKGRDETYENICRMLEMVAKEDKDTHVILTGGEPTIHPDFFRIVKKVSDLGLIRRTFIATNCITLADRDFCRKVFDAGIRKFYFGFDGTDREACIKLRGSAMAYESVRKPCRTSASWQGVGNTFVHGLEGYEPQEPSRSHKVRHGQPGYRQEGHRHDRVLFGQGQRCRGPGQ